MRGRRIMSLRASVERSRLGARTGPRGGLEREKGRGGEEQRERERLLPRIAVEGVNLFEETAREVGVVDRAQPGTVDVPKSGLRDIS